MGWSNLPSLSKKLVFACAVLSVGALCLIIGVGVLNNKVNTERRKAEKADKERQEAMDYCTSKECFDTAARVLTSINKSADPCEDFYEYACGNWITNNPMPKSVSIYGSFSKLQIELQNNVRAILEDEKEEKSSAVEKSKRMYKACMDTSRIDEIGLQPLQKVVESFVDGWPLAGDSGNGSSLNINTVLALSRQTFKSGVPSLYISVDAKNTTRYLLQVDQGELGTRAAILKNPSNYTKQFKAYKTLLLGAAKEYANLNSYSASVKKQDIDALVDFEAALANIFMEDEDRRDYEKMYNSITIKDLQERSDPSQTKSLKRIEWLDIFKTMVRGSAEIDEDTTVIVSSYEFIQNFIQLINSTSPEILRNYMGARVVQAYMGETTKAMRDLLYEYNKKMTGVTEKSPRSKICANKVNKVMGMAVSSIYVDKYFPDESKKQIKDLVKNLRASFNSILKDTKWMDDDTRKAAIDKLAKIHESIGYPNYILNNTLLDDSFSKLNISEDDHFENMRSSVEWMVQESNSILDEKVDKTVWEMSPTTVNAYYEPLYNSINFPAAILQSPFFGNGLRAIDYGGIGSVIGHEMTHGFDDEGSQFDADGNLHRWWGNEAYKQFHKRTNCIVNQYDKYRIPGTDIHINGKQTQGENIADNGGVHESYEALMKSLEEKKEQKLPGLEEMTDTQLFFLGYAGVWCEHSTREYQERQVLVDPHSNARFRVNGVVSNSKVFSEAFKCPQGSAMNPKDKCKVW